MLVKEGHDSPERNYLFSSRAPYLCCFSIPSIRLNQDYLLPNWFFFLLYIIFAAFYHLLLMPIGFYYRQKYWQFLGLVVFSCCLE